MSFEAPAAFLLQIDIWDLVSRNVLELIVLAILAGFSVFSWTVILSKWQAFRGARQANAKFLRAFRKSSGFEAVMVASEQFRPSPLVAVFDFGYEEIERQVKARGTVNNRVTLERSIQLGISEELAKLDRNMNWLATTASVSPFIGLFGTVIGHYQRIHGARAAGSTSLKAVGRSDRGGTGGDRGGTGGGDTSGHFLSTTSATRFGRWARVWTTSRWSS